MLAGSCTRVVVRVFFMAFDDAGQTHVVKQLQRLGHKVIQSEPRYPDFYRLLKQQSQPPDVIVADCSKRSSHVRESGNYIRGVRVYESIPFIAYNVPQEASQSTRERIPGVVVVNGEDFWSSLEVVLASKS